MRPLTNKTKGKIEATTNTTLIENFSTKNPLKKEEHNTPTNLKNEYKLIKFLLSFPFSLLSSTTVA